MAVKLFDLDLDLQEDITTKDFKEIGDEEVVNQSIDIFITTPYRIGQGITNNLLNVLFTDMKTKTKFDIMRDIEEEFEEHYQLVKIDRLDVDLDYNNRRIYVILEWSLNGFDMSGKYSRYWSV